MHGHVQARSVVVLDFWLQSIPSKRLSCERPERLRELLLRLCSTLSGSAAKAQSWQACGAAMSLLAALRKRKESDFIIRARPHVGPEIEPKHDGGHEEYMAAAPRDAYDQLVAMMSSRASVKYKRKRFRVSVELASRDATGAFILGCDCQQPAARMRKHSAPFN